MIVLFNGPPGSGKDDACGELVKYKFTHLSFAHELLKSVVDYFNVDWHWFMEGYADRDIKENKVEYELGHRTRRQAMIYVAEEVIKPLYGKDYYAKQVVAQIQKDPTKNYCISDLGYEEELRAIVDAFGEEEVVVVQLERKGCTFKNDERKWIGKVNRDTLPLLYDDKTAPVNPNKIIETDINVPTFKIYNISTLGHFHRNVNYLLFILLEEGRVERVEFEQAG